MARMKFGDGALEVELPVQPEAVQQTIETPQPIVEKVIVEKEVDLSEIHYELAATNKKIGSLQNSINYNKKIIAEMSNHIKALEEKEDKVETITVPEVKEVTIYKNDQEEINVLETEIKALDSQIQVLERQNKELILSSKQQRIAMLVQLKQQSIVNIILGLGLILSTILKFI